MTKTDDNVLAGCVGVTVLLPLMVAYGCILEGLVAKQLWAWFIVPTFNLPALSVAQALGISILWGLFSPSPSSCESKSDEPKSVIISAIGKVTAKPLMALLVGWVVSYWM